MNNFFKWTDEAVAKFKDLYAQGLSHSQIGARLGFSRNASIGKATRLGLPHRAPPKRPEPWADAGVSKRTWHRRRAGSMLRLFEGQAGATYRRVHSAPAHSFETVTIGREATDLAPEAIANPVTLMELQEHHCRWPHEVPGEPMMYCGADSFVEIDGRRLPYCARHCRMAYRLPERRRAA